MYHQYYVPPACYLPNFYNNISKLKEICSNGFPPLKFCQDSDMAICMTRSSTSNERWAFNAVTTYIARNFSKLDEFSTEIGAQGLLSLSCLAKLHMHKVECSTLNDSAISLPIKYYEERAQEFINHTDPEKAHLADQFISEYHVRILIELTDVDAALSFANRLNPIADPIALKSVVGALSVLKSDPNIERALEFQNPTQVKALKDLGAGQITAALETVEELDCSKRAKPDARELLKNSNNVVRCVEFENYSQIDILEITGSERVSLALGLGELIEKLSWVYEYQQMIDAIKNCTTESNCNTTCLNSYVVGKDIDVLACIADICPNTSDFLIL